MKFETWSSLTGPGVNFRLEIRGFDSRGAILHCLGYHSDPMFVIELRDGTVITMEDLDGRP